MKKIFIIPDTHFPFVDKVALNKVFKAIKKEKPDVIISAGDLLDFYCFSKYSRDMDYITPKKEVTKGLKMARKMWAKINKLAPKAKKYQLIGNHDMRIQKRISEKLPELSCLFDLHALYTFPGVVTLPDSRTELVIDQLIVIHGYLSKLGDHSKKLMSSVIVGHSHTGGVTYFKYRNKILWELNSGHLADEEALPLQYTATKTKSWTVGYGLVTKIDGVWRPQFVPLIKHK